MSDRRQVQESPSQIIHRYWLRIMARGKGAVGAYCYDVARLYNDSHAECARTLLFDLTSGSPGQIMERVYRRIERWVNPLADQHLPVDVIQPLIDAMPDSLRRCCWVEVQGALGFLAARQPSASEGAYAKFAELVEVFGLLSQAAAPIMADNQIDHDDARYTPAMLREIDKMRSQLATLEFALRTRALGECGEAVLMPRGDA